MCATRICARVAVETAESVKLHEDMHACKSLMLNYSKSVALTFTVML
jgi:hypothetical protein